MNLMRRHHAEDAPDDPVAPVLTRIVSSAMPVTSAWWMPGAWVGDGCYIEGVEHGHPVDEDKLESLVVASGAAFDVVIAEPIPLIRQLVISGDERDAVWFDKLYRYAGTLLPGALAERWAADGVPVAMDHVKLIGAIYAHPIACCWPSFDGDRYHAHCIVPSRIYCDDPDCTDHS